jgi:hypothetical protein
MLTCKSPTPTSRLECKLTGSDVLPHQLQGQYLSQREASLPQTRHAYPRDHVSLLALDVLADHQASSCRLYYLPRCYYQSEGISRWQVPSNPLTAPRLTP